LNYIFFALEIFSYNTEFVSFSSFISDFNPLTIVMYLFAEDGLLVANPGFEFSRLSLLTLLGPDLGISAVENYFVLSIVVNIVRV